MPFELIQLPPDGTSFQESGSLLVFEITEGMQGNIGRHSTSEFRIRSEELKCFVSRKHAQLSVKGGVLLVQDLSSANGTFINSVMLKPYCETPLKAGDCVAFGCRKEKMVPGCKINDGEMPFRFKVNEVKIKAVRPVLVGKSKRKSETKRKSTSTPGTSKTTGNSRNGQAKRSDERDSGFDDQEVPKNKKQNTDQKEATVVSTLKGRKRNRKPSEEEEGADSEDNNTVLPKNKKAKNQHTRKNSKMYTEDSNDEGGEEDNEDDDQTEQCSSFECAFRDNKDKKGKVVSWVQCDSCDRWFHTVCVGCDYDKVKLSSHQFHCGLC